ncbi:glucose-1-phosphate adenylyltransferase subunit GlgD [Paenibacillus sp. MMS18-CY102]|uniref:glucose-1-phosphate adenylyltransferase subunit GlgD n=1 Tax=Paenibacillus sp. MMS18-CY102 TaxID=2682849 RepID=UPI001365CE5A|nr:glucose-1-phosphate adenylyltransferase subunit GlgD [Paenibacillus sp. MMS18-CY102]MWC29258.1 glucose-1-phosphate adenylyltransferase subunit GlgD [Paenibacillus sp. MMS18-CY102]
MKNKVMGVINLIHEPDELEILTAGRCPATVPFGGRYRLIDFMLSNMVNSGISRVAVFAHTKYRSLMDHLGSGKHWDLHNRQSGLFILPPSSDDQQELRRGDLYHMFQNRDYFTRSQQEFVVISRSHVICNIDLRPVIDFHERQDADITVVCKRQTDLIPGKSRKVELNSAGRVIGMQDHYGRMNSDLLSTEIYVMRREFLMELVETSLAQGQEHLVRHAIMSRLDRLNVYGYLFEGYLGMVNTLDSYYWNNMQMLRSDVWKEVFFRPGPIYTKVKDEPPARYLEGAKVTGSLIANGCVVEGMVINSVLFRGVKVRKGAIIRNSIVMQNGIIGENSVLDYAILDKDVVIDQGRDIRGAAGSPFLAGKRKVI